MRPELLTVFVLGMAYGSTICSLSCLPILASCLLSTGQGFKDGMSLSFSFLQGKVVAYAFMGGLAAWLGGSFLQTTILPQPVVGMVVVAIGMWLPFVGQKKCSQRCGQSGRRLPLFTLGMTTSLTPCPPLLAILAVAAQQGSIVAGTVCGAVFGGGLMMSPLLLAGGGVATIGNSISMKSGRVIAITRALSALLIMSLGIRLILSA